MKRASSLSAVALAAGLLLAGCGNATGPSAEAKPKSPSMSATSSSPSTPTTAPSPTPKPLPKCSDIWVAGKRLPGGYRGCAPAGVLAQRDRYYCESGQVLVTFKNHFFAAKTGKIFSSADVRNDSRWKQKLTTCRG